MESCPKVEIKNFNSLLKEESLYLTTEVNFACITMKCCFYNVKNAVYWVIYLAFEMGSVWILSLGEVYYYCVGDY